MSDSSSSISSFLRIPLSLPLSNSSTVVGWVVDAVSKEHTMLHQDTRNPRSQALSPVCAQEDGLTWQNWSNVLFLLSQTALCLVWAGAPQTHRRAVALPGEQHSSLEKSLVSQWGTTADENPQAIPSALRSYMGAHVHTPTPPACPSKGQETPPCHTTQ